MEAIKLAKSIIDKSQNILIYPSPDLQGDSLGSALALFYTLKKLGKNVNVDIKDIPEKFCFLTNLQSASSGDFVISINTDGKDIGKMRYEKNHKDLKIYLAMNKGEIKRDDINFSLFANADNLAQNPDLLISVGMQSLSDLPQSFWKSAVLNIDNQPQNENFGEVNLIETTSALAEITSNLIKSMGGEELFDEKTATCLLTGVIWSSQNFRSPKTRPQTFETSAFLIERGANHQEIVQHLYKQKSLAQIKLLGKVLEKLNLHEGKEIYSALLRENDFKECQAGSKDLAFVLEELKFHFRHLPNLLILWESHASPPITKGIFYSPNLNFSEKILENFEGVSKGAGVLFIAKETDLNIVQEKVLNIL
ncbi:MAG: hypothetical protein HYW69_02665 [Candidatus Nealsonbacteria bacterium]|nr:hypothetical protein [Candidatus Nealsonbacteria bacterium]